MYVKFVNVYVPVSFVNTISVIYPHVFIFAVLFFFVSIHKLI